jgi:hypothetical protein
MDVHMNLSTETRTPDSCPRVLQSTYPGMKRMPRMCPWSKQFDRVNIMLQAKEIVIGCDCQRSEKSKICRLLHGAMSLSCPDLRVYIQLHCILAPVRPHQPTLPLSVHALHMLCVSSELTLWSPSLANPPTCLAFSDPCWTWPSWPQVSWLQMTLLLYFAQACLPIGNPILP